MALLSEAEEVDFLVDNFLTEEALGGAVKQRVISSLRNIFKF